jgi:D-alanyl-D-alanine carboxypeptidase
MRRRSIVSAKLLLNSAVAALVIATGLLVYKPPTTGQVNPRVANKNQERASHPDVSNKDSNRADSRGSLTELIDRAIDEGQAAKARWGVSVISMNDGQPLYSRNADRLFTPASNMKVYTTAVALDLLGADYQWRTSIYADAEPDASGAINGDLVLYGRGAPDLVSQTKKNNDNSLARLADDLYNRGVIGLSIALASAPKYHCMSFHCQPSPIGSPRK